MISPERLVYYPAREEQYGRPWFIIFIASPALIAAPWWLLLTLGSITWTIVALAARP